MTATVVMTENRGEFDIGVDFRIGDPNVHFRAAAAKSYETTEDVGKPDWSLLFGYIPARISQTKLDVLPGFRNTVLRTKQVIIGCGGGFHQECTQPYSPVARWMSEVDVALNDEGQQCGNLDEASAIARVSRKGLVIWCGDHKQTPGGLRESDEARVFRRKLMRRPIALRGDTKFLPPHMLGAIVHPYVQDVPGPQVAGLSQLLQESTRQPLGLSTRSVTVFQELCKETIGSCWDAGITPCCCAAIAVLWLALAPERFPLQADTFSRAAGTAGKQKWSLILPSSARISELTCVTIIGTRYPELDNFQNDIFQFGNYLQAEQCTGGGFLPIFWDAPYSYINASTDIGEVVDWITDKFVVANKGDLAVLHNRNKMVNAFANTEWVSGSGGAIISRSVTCCAGMTAYLVLLAQTRVGFLFFFWPVPCALEALTVINPLVEIVHSHAMRIKWNDT